MKKRISLKALERTVLIIILSISLFLGYMIAYINRSFSQLEEISKLESFRNKIPSKVYDIKGRLFAEFFYQKREIIHFDDIPKNLINALVSMEDNNFYSHAGLDLLGMIRALLVDIAHGSFKQGGSTITQQLAKRLFTGSQKTITRKIKELWYSMQIEKKYSKNEILELYFNEIYFGHGAYGVEAASQIFFRKSARDINLAECALLAALPSAPNFYSPLAFPNRAKMRQRAVLLKMAELGYITRKQADVSFENFWKKFSKNNISPTLSAWNTRVDKAPYFTEYVRQQLLKIFSKDRINEDGLRIYTTMNLDWQNKGRTLLCDTLHQLKTNYHATQQKYVDSINNKFQDPIELLGAIFNIKTLDYGNIKTMNRANRMVKETWKAPLLLSSFVFGLQNISKLIDFSYNYNPKATRILSPEGALVAINPDNGFVNVLIGGRKFSPNNRFNRAVQAYRQPGSAFKPFVYLAALQTKNITAATTIDDSPVAYQQANGKIWIPRNYDRHYSGRIVLRDALRWSVNIVSVKLLDIIGYERVTKTAATLLHINRDQIEKRFIRAHSLALGGSEVTPFELCNAFAIFANYGKDVQPISILKIYDRDGKILHDFLRKRDFDKSGNRIPQPQLIEKPPLYVLITMMEDVVKRGTARQAKVDAKLERQVAGKTGTASNWKDIWFAGFTPQLAATVWLGFDDPGVSLGRSAASSTVAAPIVMHFFKYALGNARKIWYRQPPGIYKAKVCRISGLRPTRHCTDTYEEYFVQGSGVKGKCEECKRMGNAIKKFNVFDKKNNPPADSNKDKTTIPSLSGGQLNTDDIF